MQIQGLLIGDELAENGAIRRTRSRWGNRAIRAEKPKLAYAPHGTTLDHSNVSGQTRELCLSILFTLRAEALKACLRSRDCDLAQSPTIYRDLTTGTLHNGYARLFLDREEIAGDTNSNPDTSFECSSTYSKQCR